MSNTNNTSNTSKKTKPFFAGVPTEVDLTALQRSFPPEILATERRRIITHTEIAEAAGIQQQSTRYRTIIGRWKRALLHPQNGEPAIHLEAVRGVGYRVLEESDRALRGVAENKRIAQKSRKTVKDLSTVDTTILSNDDLKKYDQVMRRSTMISQYLTREDKIMRAEVPMISDQKRDEERR